MTDISKNWVIAWKPFKPDGMFIGKVDFGVANAVKGAFGLTNAEKFSKSEVAFMLDVIGEYMNIQDLIPVDLGDHYF